MLATAERSWLNRAGWLVGEQIVSLPTALYANRRYLAESVSVDALPAGEWAVDESSALLDRSEDRLQSLEGKGAGLATVCGIVAAAIAVAISLDWTGTTVGGRVILVLAAAYSAMSLFTPIVLVGPVRRATVTTATLHRAATSEQPAAYLANEKAQAAANNDRANQRLSNLQAASRNDVRNAVLLFVVWALLILTGIAKT